VAFVQASRASESLRDPGFDEIDDFATASFGDERSVVARASERAADDVVAQIAAELALELFEQSSRPPAKSRQAELVQRTQESGVAPAGSADGVVSKGQHENTDR